MPRVPCVPWQRRASVETGRGGGGAGKLFGALATRAGLPKPVGSTGPPGASESESGWAEAAAARARPRPGLLGSASAESRGHRNGDGEGRCRAGGPRAAAARLGEGPARRGAPRPGRREGPLAPTRPGPGNWKGEAPGPHCRPGGVAGVGGPGVPHTDTLSQWRTPPAPGHHAAGCRGMPVDSDPGPPLRAPSRAEARGQRSRVPDASASGEVTVPRPRTPDRDRNLNDTSRLKPIQADSA